MVAAHGGGEEARRRQGRESGSKAQPTGEGGGCSAFSSRRRGGYERAEASSMRGTSKIASIFFFCWIYCVLFEALSLVEGSSFFGVGDSVHEEAWGDSGGGRSGDDVWEH